MFTKNEISRTPTGNQDAQGREIIEVVTERYRTMSESFGISFDDANELAIEMSKRINAKRNEIDDLNRQIKELQLLQRIFSVISRDTPVK